MVAHWSSKPIGKGSSPLKPANFKMLYMTHLQQQIVILRKDGLTYAAIQLKLGNPSKKFIKDTLKEYAPELLGDVVLNWKKLQPKF